MRSCSDRILSPNFTLVHLHPIQTSVSLPLVGRAGPSGPSPASRPSQRQPYAAPGMLAVQCANNAIMHELHMLYAHLQKPGSMHEKNVL